MKCLSVDPLSITLRATRFGYSQETGEATSPLREQETYSQERTQTIKFALRREGDTMSQQRPLKDEPTLSDSEFAKAILGAISDGTAGGRARQLGIALLHQALQAVNPLQITVEDVVLYERTTSGDLPAVSLSTPVQLDIKTGVTRHNFNDGYFGFTFFLGRSRFTSPNPDRFYHQYQQFVTKGKWFATQKAGGEIIRIGSATSTRQLWKASDTSFLVYGPPRGNTYTYKVVGHKLELRLKTP